MSHDIPVPWRDTRYKRENQNSSCHTNRTTTTVTLPARVRFPCTVVQYYYTITVVRIIRKRTVTIQSTADDLKTEK